MEVVITFMDENMKLQEWIFVSSVKNKKASEEEALELFSIINAEYVNRIVDVVV